MFQGSREHEKQFLTALNEMEAEAEDHWDMLNLYWERRRLMCILSMLEQVTGVEGSIIDVGCGDGVVLWHLESVGVHQVGVDLSLTRLHRTQSRCHFLCVQAEATQLPFFDRTFDIVVCTDVLEHLPNMEKAVSELARICTDRGHILIGVPCCNMYRKVTGKKRYISPYTHLREFSYLDVEGFEPMITLIDLFQDEGFVLARREGTCVFSINAYQNHTSSLFHAMDGLLSRLPVRGLHLYEVLLFGGMK
ncbi:MAG: class I SAM-dependent methyltransferase [Theionarchaea archaeon]|nr:class I SAM-dependent methyltransferase [Theionarchaea archaeon]